MFDRNYLPLDDLIYKQDIYYKSTADKELHTYKYVNNV